MTLYGEDEGWWTPSRVTVAGAVIVGAFAGAALGSFAVLTAAVDLLARQGRARRLIRM